MLKLRARKGFTLVELMVAVIIFGLLGTFSVTNFKAMRDSSDNASVASNVKLVQAGLEQYRSDYGHLPTNIYGAGQGFLCDTSINASRRYLPNNHLPGTPFCKGYQNNNLAASTTPQALAGNANPGLALKNLHNSLVANPGTPPSNVGVQVNFLATDFGSIRYSCNNPMPPAANLNNNDLYLIQAVGREKRAAIVVENVTNAI